MKGILPLIFELDIDMLVCILHFFVLLVKLNGNGNGNGMGNWVELQ